jgi:hypothetical protein
MANVVAIVEVLDVRLSDDKGVSWKKSECTCISYVVNWPWCVDAIMFMSLNILWLTEEAIRFCIKDF